MQPLEDISSTTSLLHPHRFLSANQEEAARLLAKAAEQLQPLPPGWEILFPAMEGYGASLCLVPPADTPLQSMDLRSGLRLALADVSPENLQGMLQLAAAAVGGPVESALELLQAGQSRASLSEAVATLRQAAAAAEAWVMEQYTSSAEAAAAVDGAPAARSTRPRRAAAAPPSAPPAAPERFLWTTLREAQFDAAIEELGAGLDAKVGWGGWAWRAAGEGCQMHESALPHRRAGQHTLVCSWPSPLQPAAILALMTDPEVTLRIVQRRACSQRAAWAALHWLLWPQ